MRFILPLALCLAATQAVVAPPAQAEPNGVGLTDVVIADPEGLRPVQVHLLYPTEATEQPPILFGGNGALKRYEAVPDAPLAKGTFPLILISHGLYGMASNYGWLTTELAASGMIVANVKHPGTAWIDKGTAETPKLWQRPRDLSRTITYLLDDPDWQPAIDHAHIAAIGHSLGGYTVMALAGGRFDRARYQNYCDASPERADCRWYREVGVAADAAGRESLESPLGDDRLAAVVSFDLGLAQAFDRQSVAAIDIPTYVIGAGSHLRDLPVEAESRHLAGMLPPATSTYLESDEITHFTFFSECRPGAREKLIAIGEGDEMICDDGGDRPRSELHAELIETITGFLRDAGFRVSTGS